MHGQMDTSLLGLDGAMTQPHGGEIIDENTNNLSVIHPSNMGAHINTSVVDMNQD